MRIVEPFLPDRMDSDKSNSKLSIAYITTLLIICSATAFVGAVPTRNFGHDDFFLLDNGWRIVCGQRPHLDFFSPWGPIIFLVVGLGLSLSNASVNGIGYANAIFGLIVGLWAFGLSRWRLTPVFRFVCGIYLTLLLTAPYSLGTWPLLSSHGMLYNRYGYALLGLLLLECVPPTQDLKDAGEMRGGISTGVILALALFLKASYALVSMPLIVASFLLRRSNIQRFLGMALGFCIILFVMLAYLRFNIGTVVEAFWIAAGARANAIHTSVLFLQLQSQLPLIPIVIAILYFHISHGKAIGSTSQAHQTIIWALLVFASDSLLMISNMQQYSMPLLGVFAVLIASRVHTELQQFPVPIFRQKIPYPMVVLLLCAALILHQAASDLVGLADGVLQKAYSSKNTAQVRFTEPHLYPLILYDTVSLQQSNGSIYTNYVNDGVMLLRRQCDSNDRVLTMDMVNPFPYALKWRPPRGGVAAVAFNYTLSASFRPSFDSYFGDATVVMVPKHPAQIPVYIDGFYNLYIPALLERYKLVSESDWFWLYKRK